LTDNEGTTPAETRATDGLITCRQCGNDVPRLSFCIRCGDPLDDEYNDESLRQQRSRFAAAPDEPLATVALTSTLFPQLPRAEMRYFRIALLAGAAIVLGLALLGLYPVALVSAAVLVPLLMVMYVYVVDIYEDEPLSIIGATMLWGAGAGVLYGFLSRALPTGSAFGEPDVTAIMLSGLVMPLVEGALMLAGPLFLLQSRRFNDVLDGATFGAASAVSFAGAHVIVQSLPMINAGLRPAGDPLPWAVQLLSLGLLQPVIAAGAIGSVAGAFWLRYRAPVTDRRKLGLVGVPAFAVLAGAVLLMLAGLAKTLLTLIPATIALAVLAAVALLWLRATIHLGLLQESREIDIERTIRCPNCGHSTPEHTFCGNCGVSLRALPRAVRSRQAKAEATE
jgi:RsiW-degrading membrane proteinase PrsW (M82 family)/ribosomal protein L32